MVSKRMMLDELAIVVDSELLLHGLPVPSLYKLLLRVVSSRRYTSMTNYESYSYITFYVAGMASYL